MRSRWGPFAAALVLSLAACAGPAGVRRFTPELAREVDALFAGHDRPDVPGYAVGVLHGGRLVHARGYGAADLDSGAAITTRTVFDVASLAKSFTAAALALLVLEGRVSPDDEVRRHVPELPARFGAVRVEHLVYMTSGLPEYLRQPRPGELTWERDPFTVDDALAASFAAPAPDFEPGSAWAYSNVNFMLIAELVERVSGDSFARFSRRRLFEPLDMLDTFVDAHLARPGPRRAVGYAAGPEGGFEARPRISPHYGGSGLFTSVEDLARWDRSLSGHVLAGPELTALLLSTRRFGHDKTNDAWGLVWGEHAGLRTLWYAGSDLGFSSAMIRLPEAGLCVIVLSNRDDGASIAKAREVLDVLIDG